MRLISWTLQSGSEQLVYNIFIIPREPIFLLKGANLRKIVHFSQKFHLDQHNWLKILVGTRENSRWLGARRKAHECR
jgi:hypothetical protein